MKIKHFLQAVAVNLVACFLLPLSLSTVAHASTANSQKQNITFYIDNQIINSDKATIRLVRGYTDHPILKNLYTENKITVPEGEYVLSVTVNDGYEFDPAVGDCIFRLKNVPDYSSFCSSDSLNNDTAHLYINSKFQNQTLVISSKIKKDYSENYEVSDERFYSWHPELKGKEFNYELNLPEVMESYSYTITKNGKTLSPNDKLKVGDKLRVIRHHYDQNSFQTIDFLNNVPFVYNDSGELYIDYTITTDDISFSLDNNATVIDSKIRLILGGGTYTCDFTNWKGKVNITSSCEAGGSFNIFKITLDRNNKETLAKITSDTRIVPGNRLKLEPIPVTGWEFEKWNVEGGILTANSYVVVTDDEVNISAVFHKKHDIVNPSIGGGTPSTYQPANDLEKKQLELALDKAKYALSLAQENLRQANVALENARKKKSYVFTNGGFTQVADTNAIKEAELDVQRAELTYREATLNYQQIQTLINNSTPSVNGDTDGDGKFSVLDVAYLLDQCFNKAPYSQKYDINKDENFNIFDIASIVDIYMNR